MSLEACTRLPGALEQKFASKMCQVRIAIATAISDKFAGSETSAPKARADRVRRERGDAPAVVHAARGLAPRARRAGRRVSKK